jgi:hypothetical protein
VKGPPPIVLHASTILVDLIVHSPQPSLFQLQKPRHNNYENAVMMMLRVVVIALLVSAGVVRSLSLSRRQALHSGVAVSSAGLLLGAEPAQAARGAAELDLEYYLRDLMGGNVRQGSVEASTPLAVPSPRVVKDPLRTALLTEDFGAVSVPVQTLVEQLVRQQRQQQPQGSAAVADVVLREIQVESTQLRDKVARSFAARAPWQLASTTDQYYLDVSAYALWRTAAALLPLYVDREVFVRTLGRNLYQRMCTEGWLAGSVTSKVTTTTTVTRSTSSSPSLVATMPEIYRVLDLFRESNFCKDYRLGEDLPMDKQEQRGKKNKVPTNVVVEPPIQLMVVDELDDEALAAGGTVDLLVRIMEPATLGAALQINGEQSRFSPDFVGPTLAAVWEAAGLASTWESFFIDPVYRPNPKDYYPTEQLLQFTLRIR